MDKCPYFTSSFPCASPVHLHLRRRIDIVAKKHDGGRGQAFVVFAEQTAATAALRGLSGEQFYGRNLVRTRLHPSTIPHFYALLTIQDIVYAKKPSNATLAREDPSKSREAAAIKAAKLVVSNAQGEYEQLEKEREEQEAGLGKRQLDDAEAGPNAKRAKQDEGDDEEMEIEMEDDEDGAWSHLHLEIVSKSFHSRPALPQANGSGVYLICTNLPPECNEDIMGALFSQSV
jgi:RNA recognition motif-containing protein